MSSRPTQIQNGRGVAWNRISLSGGNLSGGRGGGQQQQQQAHAQAEGEIHLNHDINVGGMDMVQQHIQGGMGHGCNYKWFKWWSSRGQYVLRKRRDSHVACTFLFFCNA